MSISRIPLLKGVAWTAGAFGACQLLRLASNIILARLLAPELFGIMQIVYSVRNGIELISDVGITQNIVYNSNANDPKFYNTAWSLQLTRGVLLWIAFCIISVPVAKFYQSSILVFIIPIAAFSLVLSGLSSASHALARKRMEYGRLAAFDTIVALVFSIAQVTIAYFSRTIWALVFGSLIGTMISAIGSHFLLSDVRHKFLISKLYAFQILSFGKWIFVSSIIFFLSTNFDRLYLAKVVPLELLGVYGIARALSEFLSAATLQLGNSVIFPFVSSHSSTPRPELHKQLAPLRMKFLLAAGIGFSVFAVTADLAIGVLYDQRYQAASWMLPVLIIGAWFTIMSNLNESILMGLGRPNYSAFANSGKFGFLVVALPLSIANLGVVGGVLVVAASDLCRYIPILIGQNRERFSFGGQDLFATITVFGLIVLWEWLRRTAGFGTSFEAFPLDSFSTFGTALKITQIGPL